MEISELLALDKLRDTPFHLVPSTDPSLFATLDEKAGRQRRETLNAAFTGTSTLLREHLANVDYRLGDGVPLGTLVLDGLAAQQAPEEVAREATDRLLELEGSSALADPAAAETNIGEHPLFAAELQQATVARLGLASALNMDKSEQILETVHTPATVGDAELGDLVGRDVLDPEEADELGLTATLYHLADDSVEVAERLRKALADEQMDGSARFRTLAGLGRDGWLKAITAGDVTPPDGSTKEEFARRLDRTMTRLFPTDAMMTRSLAGPNRTVLIQALGSNATAAERRQLTELVRSHPGLRLDDIVDSTATPEAKAEEIGVRVDLLKKVYEGNPEVELLTLDYTPDSPDVTALHFGTMTRAERRLVLDDLKAHQRMFALTDDVDDAHRLLRAGYHTAVTVAAGSRTQLKESTGFDDVAVDRYYKTASTTVVGLSTSVMAVGDILRGGFTDLAVANLGADIEDFLKKVPGFADLFGNQDYCECPHCQSILGPAAYFVDLMSFVDEHVRDVYFTGSAEGDGLDLKTRRPDLWTLPLTCANTDTLVRHLDVVNEVLENYIALRTGYQGRLDDRAAVEDSVYRRTLAVAVDSFRQPFHLPLVKLAGYLAHFGKDRGDIADTFTADTTTRVAARFGLSAEAHQLITEPNTDLAFLNRIYGLQFTESSTGLIAPVEVQAFLRATGVTRAELDELAAVTFVTPDGVIEIKSAKRSPDSAQNDIERIHGLRRGSLDRLHRFVRLVRQTPWSIPELDLLIGQLIAGELSSGLGGTTLRRLADVLALHRDLAISVEQNCALWGPIPRRRARADRASLFDRLFNLPAFILADGALPKPTVSFVHPSLRASGTPSPPDNTLHRLLAGLGVTDEALAALIAALAGPLGANPQAPNEADRGFLLTETNLTLLYRHARLSQLLKMPVADLSTLIDRAGLRSRHVDGMAALQTLLDVHAWWQGSGYSLEDLALITGAPVARAGDYPDPQAVATSIVTGITADAVLEFSDTVFAFLPGMTESASRAVIAANAAILETATPSGRLHLADTFDPAATVVVPPGTPAAEHDLRAVLLRHHASTVLPSRSAAALGIGTDVASELIAMTGVSLADPALARALHGGPIRPLVALVHALVPLSVLFGATEFDAAAVAFVRANPRVFRITRFTALDMQAIRHLTTYVRFARAGAQTAFATAATPLDAADLRHSLATFDPVTKFAATDRGRLAATVRVEASLVETLLPNLPLPDNAADALEALAAAADLCGYFDVGADTLKLATSADYGDLHRAAEAMLAAFRAKYPVEGDFAAKLEPHLDAIAEQRRDGLADYLISSIQPEFATLDELYEHFLLDVHVGGVMRTSPVVTAISSVQLYVQRVLLNLEQDRRDPTDPKHIAVPPAAIPVDEWEWRKNYRVWEANRKVFLWPENYLEPELRDDKTPLFTQLESDLLQRRIEEQSVADAYATYLGGFHELSGLAVAGAFHDKDPASRTDVLHLLGVTPGEPPTYYYRAVTNAQYGETEPDRSVAYGAWRRMDVQIPVRKVAPVIHLGRLYVFWTEVITTPNNKVSGGSSEFVGYKHRLAMKYTSLRLDGRWTPPHQIKLTGGLFPTGDGIVDDPLAEQAEADEAQIALANHRYAQYRAARARMRTPRYDTKTHNEPVDGYTLVGAQWDRVYPESADGSLRVTGRNFLMRATVDLYRGRIDSLDSLDLHAAPANPVLAISPIEDLYRIHATQPWQFVIDDYAHASVLADLRRLDDVQRVSESSWVGQLIALTMGPPPPDVGFLDTSPDITVVGGSISDAIIDLDGDLLYLQGSARPGSLYVAKRLGTTLGDRMQRQLFTGGVDGLLSTDSQQALGESPLRGQFEPIVDDRIRRDAVDFRGGMGTYFREVFFHIPFLIADHLNGQRQYAAAQRWFQYLFDPTSADVIAVPPGTPPAERDRRQRDRVWQYAEFRGLDLPTLRQVLTDPAAIEVYKSDPFNPHAIARLRLSAYQKCIVMRYVDNLLDWGDDLFARFTTESVNEATGLYAMAADVLGPRPASLGSCGEATVTPRTYEAIGPVVRSGSEFLPELETLLWSHNPQREVYGTRKRVATFALPRAEIRYFADRAAQTTSTTGRPRTADGDGRTPGVAKVVDWSRTRHASWQGGTTATATLDRRLITDIELMPRFGWSVIRQVTPVFGIPANPELRDYWDRVEDRLYKLRHGMDIAGIRRQLALFAPEIDPRLLVRAKAAGLSLTDVLESTSGDLPPYRFSYLVEKAKQYAALVQSFGMSLLAALEKKDVEELTQLRTIHQQNLLTMTTQVRNAELQQSMDTLASLEFQKAGVQYRLDYFAGLLDGDLTASERVQQISRHIASATFTGGALLQGTAGVLSLLPQLGSPFAMKYGGVELRSSAKAFGQMLSDTAKVAEVISTSAGLEAGFSRRREGWEHQRRLAENDLKVLEQQVVVAATRKEIAQRSLELHNEQISQVEEVFELFGQRFSNLGLYTWLASNLQRLHREAFDCAFATARLAEEAYRFERVDETTPLLSGGYFDAGRSGLLAGERLMLALENMERRFIETNYRTPEIDQAFSLNQVNPAALVQLRETGACAFAIPEVFFDLFYPGHYRRRIKSVRLSIPCVTGPYTNVPATLSLTDSWIRRDPRLGAASLLAVPPRRSISVATSTGQNDAGVFEFSFRDERYMPFEGAGAVSDWRLELPKTFRPFDYQTITDVILHVNYTAEADGALRTQVEQANAGLDGTIMNYLTNNATGRLYSMRQEFSTELSRLMNSPTGTAVKLRLTERHLPVFLRSRAITVTAARLLLRTRTGQSVGTASFTVNGAAVSGFVPDTDLGNLPAADVTTAFADGLTGDHTLTLTNAGDLSPENPQPGDPTTLDPEKLTDILLHLELRLV